MYVKCYGRRLRIRYILIQTVNKLRVRYIEFENGTRIDTENSNDMRKFFFTELAVYSNSRNRKYGRFSAFGDVTPLIQFFKEKEPQNIVKVDGWFIINCLPPSETRLFPTENYTLLKTGYDNDIVVFDSGLVFSKYLDGYRKGLIKVGCLCEYVYNNKYPLNYSKYANVSYKNGKLYFYIPTNRGTYVFEKIITKLPRSHCGGLYEKYFGLWEFNGLYKVHIFYPTTDYVKRKFCKQDMVPEGSIKINLIDC